MMDNLAANKNNVPCQSWAGQNGWSTVSTQGSLFSPLPSSQHLSLDLSSSQRPSCDHLQASIHSCMRDISTLQSTHRTAMYETSHSSSNSSSIALFANTAIPSSSHGIPFAQQNPHTSSMLLPTNQGKHVPPPSLPQTNQAPQPCRPQQLPLLSNQGHYKASFQPPFTDEGLPSGLQDLPLSLPSCGQQQVSTSQATSDGANVEFMEFMSKLTVVLHLLLRSSFIGYLRHTAGVSTACNTFVVCGMFIVYWRMKSLIIVVTHVGFDGSI